MTKFINKKLYVYNSIYFIYDQYFVKPRQLLLNYWNKWPTPRAFCKKKKLRSTMQDNKEIATDGKVFVSAEQQRMDRQLRLWGMHGQSLLKSARLLCLGSSATSTEIIKNLVLPQIGTIQFVDDANVTLADRGNNFFVRASDVGSNRAECCARHLKVLNPSVHFLVDTRSPQTLIERDINLICNANFDIVLDTCLDEPSSRVLASKCWLENIPLVRVRVNGLLGHIRLAFPEFATCETHDNADVTDLFIHPDQVAAWPEYKEYLESFENILEAKRFDDNGNELDETKRNRSHIPLVALLHLIYRKWRQTPEGLTSPRNSTLFKQYLKKQAWKHDDENFNQAVSHAFRIMTISDFKEDVINVLENPKAESKSITSVSRNNFFWLCVRALLDWRANEGQNRLPVSNDIPDMHCFTKNYTTLKAIFAARSAAETAQITARVTALCSEKGITFDGDFLTRFIKNVRRLRMQTSEPLDSEYINETFRSEYVEDIIQESDDSPELQGIPKGIEWYFAFRAAETFHQLYGRYPGISDELVSSDVEQLTQIGLKLTNQLNVGKGEKPVDSRVYDEFVRYGHSEPHNIAAMIGGIASQEILKLIIGQFVPQNNTIIVNGIHGIVSPYQL